MDSIKQKLEYLKWLKLIGIEYYLTEKSKRNNFTNAIGNYSKEIENMDSKTKLLEEKKLGLKREKSIVYSNNQERSSLEEARSLSDKVNSLQQLKEAVLNFNGCTLKNFALNTVFGDGNPKAKIMLLGEAPGVKEDETGIPFCGESGMLLDLILSTINLSRKRNIYITNTVFWRPPANRKPTNEEISICKPFLEKHIAIVNPKLLICIGNTAVNTLFNDNSNISSLRNRKHFYQNKYLFESITTTAIFHPAYLLRQPTKKKETWFDILKIKKLICDMFLEL